jgi:hypothetical protein
MKSFEISYTILLLKLKQELEINKEQNRVTYL